MANLGEITEVVNATETTLDVGSNRYILLKNLVLHIGRTESRDATTDGGALYSYGKSENFFTATLVVSTPEMDSLNTLTQIDSDGDMTSTAWKIVYNNVAGASKTWAATGILKELDITKNAEGLVEMSIFVRITGDTITVS